MRFIYEYKTKDNERQSGEINAASRNAVYQELKKQGIKPFRVELAPGLVNWLASLGKRTAAIVVLALLCLMLGVVVRSFQKENTSLNSSLLILNSSFENKTRRQVIGDAAIIEKGIRTGWADVFADEGERFLASFAIPGVPAGQRTTTEEEMAAALARRIVPTESDGIEARQIKAMVEGMKDEAHEFIRSGGTIKQFGACLTERQDKEIAIYERTKSEIESAKTTLNDDALIALWEQRNNLLRNLGIKLIPLPE